MNMGSEKKLHLATGAKWNSLSSFIWLVFIICCSALPWQTGGWLKMISVVHLHLASPLPPPESCLRCKAYGEVSTCFLGVGSWWRLPSSTRHTEHDYNTVCHWLDAAIVVHTPVTLTLREKREAALPRSRVESQAPTRPSPAPRHSTSICPRGASVSQKPS